MAFVDRPSGTESTPQPARTPLRDLRAFPGAWPSLSTILASFALLVGLEAIVELSWPVHAILLASWSAFAYLLLRHGKFRVWPALAFVGIALTVGLSLKIHPVRDSLSRFVSLWPRGSRLPPYRIVVTSADPVVRRGDPITLSAYVDWNAPDSSFPEQAILQVREAHFHSLQNFPMTGDGKGTFFHTWPNTTGEFEYRVEVGAEKSDWHTVTAVEPVDLAPASRVSIRPPAYAATAANADGPLTTLHELQYATATFHLVFTRPAMDAFLETRADGSNTFTTRSPLAIGENRLTAEGAVTLLQTGVVRVITVSEENGRKLQTVTTIPSRVTPDLPPRIERLAGLPARGRTIRPTETMLLELAAVDDLAVAGVDFEYQLGAAGPVVREPIPCERPDAKQAVGRFRFSLPGTIRDGERFRCRVRVTDNRSLTNPALGPQECTFPATGWVDMTVSSSAPSLVRQETEDQRLALAEAVVAAQEKIQSASHDAGIVLAEFQESEPFSIDQTVRLQNARERGLEAASILRSAAAAGQLAVELHSLTAILDETADSILKPAAEDLQQATTEANRLAVLQRAQERLRSAEPILIRLLASNDRRARDRLDHQALVAARGDQSRLVKEYEAGRLSAVDANHQQRQIQDRLANLLAESVPLRTAIEALTAQDARRLIPVAEQLARRQRELNEARTLTHNQVLATLREPILQGQRALADDVAGLSARLDLASRLVGLNAPRAESVRGVTALLLHDARLEALTEQEKIANTLERLLPLFETWIVERRDPKLAARQLARWQDDLRLRLAEATLKTPFSQLPATTRSDFVAEQMALRQAVEQLPVPANTDVAAARTLTALKLHKTTASFATEGADSGKAMQDAAESLMNLAEQIPGVPERLARSRVELERLRTEQDAIAVLAESTFRLPPRPAVADRLANVQALQRKVAASVAALDLPGLEARRARLLEALTAAADDLRDHLVLDVAASHAAVRREFDRLKQASDGITPLDAAVDALARKQSRLKDELARIAAEPAPALRERWLAEQREIARQLTQLPVAEAPALLHDARDAAKRTELALRDGVPLFELQKRAVEATHALGKLSERLQGYESELDRVRRLAQARRRAIRDAKAVGDKPFNTDTALEARAQLSREIDELQQARVGPAQPTKRKVLDLFARLKPGRELGEREANLHAALADALDELAAGMAATPALTAARPREVPTEAENAADAFLPSRDRVEQVRALAQRQRELRQQTIRLEEELRLRLTPEKTPTLPALVAIQRVFAQNAVHHAAALAHARDPRAESALHAADCAGQAAERLEFGLLASAETAMHEAIRAWNFPGEARPRGRGPELAARQEVIRHALLACASNAAASQQKRVQEELHRGVSALKRDIDHAARSIHGSLPDAAAQAFTEAKEHALRAEAMMAEVVRDLERGTGRSPEPRGTAIQEALQLAANAFRAYLAQVSDGESQNLEAAAAVREADQAMRQAAKLSASLAEQPMILQSLKQGEVALEAATLAMARQLRMPEAKNGVSELRR